MDPVALAGSTTSNMDKYIAKGLRPCALLAAVSIAASCATIRSYRQLDQPLDLPLTTAIGGTIFRLNKLSDLPNAVGRADLFGGKVDRGYAEMKLVDIQDTTVVLDIVDVNRQSAETTMDRYRPTSVSATTVRSEETPDGVRLFLDTTEQSEIVIAGIKVTFLDVEPYTVAYTLEDVMVRQ